MRTLTVLTTVLSVSALSFFSGCKSTNTGCCDACKPACEADATFPPADVDHLGMKVQVAVEIFGIDKDIVDLAGEVVVHRTGPIGEGGKTMKGVLGGATLQGKSDVFGEVVALQGPTTSTCSYSCEGPGQYTGTFEIFGWFWLPKYGKVFYTTLPVVVTGPATTIPPVGQVAKMAAGTTIPLYEIGGSTDNPAGTLSAASGEVLAPVTLGD